MQGFQNNNHVWRFHPYKNTQLNNKPDSQRFVPSYIGPETKRSMFFNKFLNNFQK